MNTARIDELRKELAAFIDNNYKGSLSDYKIVKFALDIENKMKALS